MGITSTILEQTGDTQRQSFGSYSDDAAPYTSATIDIGFTAKRVTVYNTDNGDQFEWVSGMGSGAAMKTTGSTGVSALIVTGGISVSARTVTLPPPTADDANMRFFITG